MFYKFGVINKNLLLYIGSQGITLKKGIGNLVINNQVTDEKKEIDRNTLVEVILFNFNTNKVRVKCIKDIHSYVVEVGFKFLLDDCVFNEKADTKPVEAVYAKYYVQNILDRETAMFILVMVMTYICGMFIGRII